MDPVTEQARAAALHAYDVLDTPRDASLDKITALAAELFDTPMAAISLIHGDRQWLKSWVGDAAQEMPRSQSFCHHALRGAADGATLLVEDARLDLAFSANPLVDRPDGVRFYLGAPLVTRDGHALGALCVLDTRLHPEVDARSRRRLQVLAELVMDASWSSAARPSACLKPSACSAWRRPPPASATGG